MPAREGTVGQTQPYLPALKVRGDGTLQVTRKLSEGRVRGPYRDVPIVSLFTSARSDTLLAILFTLPPGFRDDRSG